MSCKAMGMGGDIIACGAIGAVVLYSCGPGQVIGIPGAVVCGALAGVDAIKIIMKTRELESNGAKQSEILLNREILQLDEAVSKNKKRSLAFLAGMIPLAGGFVAIAILD